MAIEPLNQSFENISRPHTAFLLPCFFALRRFAGPFCRILFFYLFVCNAQAEWLRVGHAQNIGFYVDTNSVQRDGDFARISELTDVEPAPWVDPKVRFKSVKSWIEFDCNAVLRRPLSVETYSERMAEGELVSSEKLQDPKFWPVKAGTASETMWKLACTK
jgi:hypothetical protein